MKSGSQNGRIEHVLRRDTPAAEPDDERVVLRLSRESLRAQPPAVRFIERAPYAPRPQRPLW